MAMYPDSDGYSIAFSTTDASGELGFRSHDSRGLEVVVRAVCTRCNTGWMADLEAESAVVLEPMVRGDRVHVDEGSQAIFARWASKTAVLLDAYSSGSVILGEPISKTFVRLSTHHSATTCASRIACPPLARR